MRCKYCGAEIKRGHTVCEYCGSAADTAANIHGHAAAKQHAGVETARILGSTLVKVVAVVVVALLSAGLIAVAIFANADIASPDTRAYGNTYSIPQNRTNLTAVVRRYDGQGVATLEYGGHILQGISILDEAFVEWLIETGNALEDEWILFDTDENGNITKIAMDSGMFLVLAEDAEGYTACRNDEILRFTSDTPLEVNKFYQGYFPYPDTCLTSAEKVFPDAILYSNPPECDAKKTATQKAVFSGEELTVYKILVGGQWYYCSEDVYETVQEGEELSGYECFRRPDCVTYQ